jgi:hypothetical protein
MTKLLLILVGTATLALAADPFPGSWNLNLEKSNLSPRGLERRKGEVFTIESAGKDKYRVNILRPDQKAEPKPRIWIADGKEHEEQDWPVAATMKVERISEWHLRTNYKSGGTVAVWDWAVTPDGKTLTGAPEGKPQESIVYNKQ